MAAGKKLFVGVDVGGTKIYAAAITASGIVRERVRISTPREGGPRVLLEAVRDSISQVLEEADASPPLGGIGLAVPGLVDYKKNRVGGAPNIDIAGVDLIDPLRKTFDAPAVLANDTDACTLGEKWVGSARGANTAVGVFVGTGIGGGILVGGELLRGSRYSAAEVGHMVLDLHGPVCGCGNRGCFEALAGRVALERDIRQAVAEGRPTVFAEWIRSQPSEPIRSGMIRRALDAGDALAREILLRAGQTMGQAMVTLRHIFEPDVLILGGGVMEACGDFLLPIVEEALAADPYFACRPVTRLVQSALGDDAGVLGAAALAMQQAGKNPFDESERSYDPSPELELAKDGTPRAGKKTFDGDVVVRVDGRIRRRDKAPDAPRLISAAELTENDLQRAVRGGPEILLIGSADPAPLPSAASAFLRRRAIAAEILPPKKALKRFAALRARKALLLLTGQTSDDE